MLSELNQADHWELLADFVRTKLEPLMNCPPTAAHVAISDLVERIGTWTAPHVWNLYGTMRAGYVGPLESFATDRDMIGPDYADTQDDPIHGLSRGIVCEPSAVDTGRIVRLATGKDWEDIETDRPSCQCPTCGHHSARYHAISNAGRAIRHRDNPTPSADELLAACFRRIDHITQGVK